MAIDTGYVDINNGNPGWTRKDVLDALETVFEQKKVGTFKSF